MPVELTVIDLATKNLTEADAERLRAEIDAAAELAEIRRAHSAIVEAVIAGDAALASRSRLKYLTCMTDYIG